ncbi:unnamed protein product [Onchocerca ochengi]|uniref:LIM zinc-binding domain-containing protein n=1 Tax=Onchocerca ochengi TaxID=42157 RepID=A0A182EDX6_ONCOC|nr:unnamed protein product [Onchocerca ochengi]
MYSASDSNSISRIFATSGLTLIASNKFSRRSKAKWIIRCNSCNEPVTRKQALMHRVIFSLNKVWHREHFTCVRCKCPVGHDGRPFREYRSNRNFPICIDCYMEEYHPKCNDGEFLIHNEKPYDIDCYYLTKYENELTPITNLSAQGAVLVNESSMIAGQIPEKSVQKSQNIKELQFPATTQSIETGKVTGNNSSINAAIVPLTLTPINGSITKQPRSFPLETSSKSSESTSTNTSTTPLFTTTAAPPTTIETTAPPKSALSESSK